MSDERVSVLFRARVLSWVRVTSGPGEPLVIHLMDEEEFAAWMADNPLTSD